ncbi:hypothetical protein G5V58_24065 [Nocardioides anomalus]|uniref:Uncharacterized protein n=1 Tax=Nocardioides anomalus TaxID=2712223 RepID=A0A6G6WJN3_9ACTN|nr:hypothetical protein [Nocardioides anomalus]QIG45416.1 hypothetical protein G5V58_24065 [Nocardioides anomalus]
MATDQVWTLEHDGRRHRVVAGGSFAHQVRWYVDDELRAEKKTMDDKVTVEAAGQTLRVVHSGLGTPRRATLYDAGESAGALTGLGGTDLVPAPGSRAAAYEHRVREHPTRYAALAGLGGVAKVVVPILLSVLVLRFAVSLPWPDLPSIPWPDLPSIPWPDIPWPDLPSPDLPDWSLPGWLRWVLDHATYVWPVVLAVVLARAEVRRRRDQDEKRRAAEGD